MAKRNVYTVDFKTGKRELLATFELVKDTIKATYAPDGARFKRQVEDGLVLNKGEAVLPSDGKRFYDGLPLTFAHNSFIFVEDTK